jgi:GntR family transcriptional regulator of arabinose operon
LPATQKPKYQELFESLKADILSGRFGPGQKLPSEAALVNKTGASRITVTRAIRELQSLALVDRVAGSGTYVRQASADESRPYLFGLLIPDLGETEIFEPICQGIANSPDTGDHALLWGQADTQATKPEQAWRLCKQYIARKVAGVFFAPLEFEGEAEKVNRRILSALRDADVAVVLLDRWHSKTPERKRPDLVGINNRQAGYAATEHLLRHGCKRIGFMGHHGAQSTVSERMRGYEEALLAHGLRPAAGSELHLHSHAAQALRNASSVEALEAFVCVNDRVAGELMHMFLAKGLRIPEDIRLVGIDDLAYASLLPVPLTTVRQPVREIGEAALRTMLDRLRAPHQPAREILLDGELIVRRSCGSTHGAGQESGEQAERDDH